MNFQWNLSVLYVQLQLHNKKAILLFHRVDKRDLYVWYLFNIARSQRNWGSEHLILGPWVRWWCCGAQGCAALDLSLTGAGGRRAAAGEEGDQDPSCQDSQVPSLTPAWLLGALRRPPLWEYVPCVLPFQAKLVEPAAVPCCGTF